MHIRSLIPPALFQLLRTPSMKLYNSYDAALGDSHGYEDPGVVQAVTRKTDAYRGGLLGLNEKRVDKRQTTQNMFVLSYLYHDRPIDVLEIGGACGASYFELSHLLPGKIRNWHVVETPAMVASAKRLFENDRLAFYTNMDEAASKLDRPDLLIAQGVIQYTKDPLKTLNAILKLGFEHVYITRTVVGNDIERLLITKQVVNLSEHGPGLVPEGFTDRKTSQPLTIVPLKFVTRCISVQYNILYSFDEGEDYPMRIGSQKVTTRTVGFLLRNALQKGRL